MPDVYIYLYIYISIVTARPLSPQEGARSRSPQLSHYTLPQAANRMRCLCSGMLFLATVTLLASVSGASCRELYVRPPYYPAFLCPGEPCHTLDWYIQHSDTYITSNTVFKLLVYGQHDITNPLIFQNVQNISIEGIQVSEISPLIVYRERPAKCDNVTNSNQSWAAVQFINATNVTVRDVIIVVDGVSAYQSVSALSFQHVNQLQAVDLDIHLLNVCTRNGTIPTAHGILLTNTRAANLEDIEITSGAFGIFVDMSSYVWLSKMNVLKSLVAVSINNVEIAICKSIFIRQSSYTGLAVSNSSQFLIASTIIRNITGTGVDISFCHDFSLIDLVTSNTGQNGITVRNRSSVGTIDGVTIYNSGLLYTQNIRNYRQLSGLRIVDADSISIMKVSVTRTSSNGLDVAFSSNIIVSRSTVFESRQSGIVCYWCNDVMITSTSVHNASRAGIWLNHTHNTEVTNVTLSNSGIGVSLRHTRNATLSHATISEVDDSSIVCFSASDITLLHSVICTSSRNGIDIIGSDTITVSFTTIHNIAQEAIAVSGSNYVNISNTAISNARSFIGAVHLQGSNHTSISKTIIDDVDSGIKISSSDHTTILNSTIGNIAVRYGIRADSANHVAILHTIITHVEKHGIVMIQSNYVNILYTSINHTRRYNGITIRGTTHVSIFHTTVHGTGEYGIYISIYTGYYTNFSGYYISHSTIAYTSVNNTGLHGIAINHARYVTILNTAITNIGQSKIYPFFASMKIYQTGSSNVNVYTVPTI